MEPRSRSNKRRATRRVATTTKPRAAPAAQPAEWRFENIEALIDTGEGDITIGSVASIPCVATAADDCQCLAMLVRRPGESLHALMQRLDAAIAYAQEDGDYIDEVNAPPQPALKKAAKSRR
ncbi:MAG TPA: hypothetical protein VMG60_22670 [Burkholderiaceae bacterium]|nr:hypothetical protein [Burkholderiaceae bacterium]